MTDAVDRVSRGKSAREYQLARAAENANQIEKLAAELLISLRRDPLPAERVAAEMIAAATVRSRRLREAGRCDHNERRALARLLRASPFGSAPAPERAPATA